MVLVSATVSRSTDDVVVIAARPLSRCRRLRLLDP
jgi:hypothetical protein